MPASCSPGHPGAAGRRGSNTICTPRLFARTADRLQQLPSQKMAGTLKRTLEGSQSGVESSGVLYFFSIFMWSNRRPSRS